MKFTLLVVGRTIEKHYITAINDYVERTKHFISFDIYPEEQRQWVADALKEAEKKEALVIVPVWDLSVDMWRGWQASDLSFRLNLLAKSFVSPSLHLSLL